jgi:hypothetical protein
VTWATPPQKWLTNLIQKEILLSELNVRRTNSKFHLNHDSYYHN